MVISALIRKTMILLLIRFKDKQAISTRRTSQATPSGQRISRLFAQRKGWPSENLTFLKFRTWSMQYLEKSKKRTAFCMEPYSSKRKTIRPRDCSAWSSISSKALPWRDTFESWEIRSSKSKELRPSFIPPVSLTEPNSKAALKFCSGSNRKRSLMKWLSSTPNMDSLLTRKSKISRPVLMQL